MDVLITICGVSERLQECLSNWGVSEGFREYKGYFKDATKDFVGFKKLQENSSRFPGEFELPKSSSKFHDRI